MKLTKTNVEFSDDTLEKIETLKECLNTVHKVQIVRIAIDVLAMLAPDLKKGSELFLKDKKGVETHIKIPGL
jgi:hypothetical protein